MARDVSPRAGVLAFARLAAAFILVALALGAQAVTDAGPDATARTKPPSSPITLTLSPSTALVGQAIGMTATVTGKSPGGSVTFMSGTAALGTALLAGTGKTRTAIFSTSDIPAGIHAITAHYGGDANDAPTVSAPVTLTITRNASATSLAAAPNPAAYAQPVTLSATVSGSNPTGTVTFHDGTAPLGSAALTNGSASLTALSLAEGSHMLTASYAGDAANGPSTSAPVAVSIAARAGFVWQYEHDAMGRLTKVTDPNSLSTSIRYDKLGRPVQTEQPGSTLINFGYDPALNLTSVVDPRQLTTTYAVSGLGSVKAQASPDTGNSSYTYDSRGQLQSATDARSKQATYTRDSLGRVTRITYPTGTGTTFEYDGGPTRVPGAVGKLTKMTDESGQTTYTNDGRGRLLGKTVTIGARSFTVAYGWGTNGTARNKLTSITYPSGSRVNYSYDAKADVNAVTVNPVNANGAGVSSTAVTLMTNITYNADWNVMGWQWSDGKARTIGYDALGNVTSYNLGDPAGTGNAAGVNRVLARDAAGRIKAYTHSGTGAVQALDQVFAYDSLNRLTGTTSTIYAYDATGNRTSKTIGGTTHTNTIASNSNRLIQTQDAGQTSNIVHDAAGNITSDGTNTYTYSDSGRMTSATTPGGVIGFQYNGLEQQASKSGSSTTYYVYDEAGQLLGEYDGNGNPVYETAYLGMTPVGVLKQTGSAGSGSLAVTLYYVYADQIATPRVITTQNHTNVWRWDTAEAFGGTPPEQNPSGLGVFVFNQRFPGQVADSETGLNQNWHREYSARMGRYVQSDPIGLQGGINPFGYAEQAPLMNIDPTGLFLPANHNAITREAMSQAGYGAELAKDLGARTAMADFLPGSQNPENAHWHAMRHPAWTREEAQQKFWDYVDRSIKACDFNSLARALHAAQDQAAWGHRNFAPWKGTLRPEFPEHFYRDAYPNKGEWRAAREASAAVIKRFNEQCACP